MIRMEACCTFCQYIHPHTCIHFTCVLTPFYPHRYTHIFFVKVMLLKPFLKTISICFPETVCKIYLPSREVNLFLVVNLILCLESAEHSLSYLLCFHHIITILKLKGQWLIPYFMAGSLFQLVQAWGIDLAYENNVWYTVFRDWLFTMGINKMEIIFFLKKMS